MQTQTQKADPRLSPTFFTQGNCYLFIHLSCRFTSATALMANDTGTDSGLFAIEVDADDYAETAAGDAPTVPRTYQSEADFQRIKTAYAAKIDGVPGHSTHDDLLAAVPTLDTSSRCSGERARLGKKDAQLLGYAVGELYFDRRYADVVALCERVREVCEVDGKTDEAMARWMGRCRAKMA